MEYNKSGEVNRYYDLDDILKLDIPAEIASEMEEKFGKRVFYDQDGTCKMGRLCGLEKNHKLSMLYYIVDIDGNKMFVPTWKSLTRV